MSEFDRNLAIIIGINDYQHGIPPLKTAVNDAKQLALILEKKYHYEIERLLNQEATREQLRDLIEKQLPEIVKPDDRVLFYFAGHGIALNGEDGPQGYLIPQNARLNDTSTYLPMEQLQKALTALPCRHFLGILDCCFAGAFRWSSSRDIAAIPEVIYQERYERFIRDPAWQVITSAASDQKALDILSLKDDRGHRGEHSPFAAALFKALEGEADFSGRSDGKMGSDGIITATELYLYLRDSVELDSSAQNKRQTPGIWPLDKHDKGEYIFLVPDRELNLPPAPPLDESKNPYRGLEPYEEKHSKLFFGRTTLVEQLCDAVCARPLSVVLGTSGAGKSSLVKAGLIPHLKQSQIEPTTQLQKLNSDSSKEPHQHKHQLWEILPTIRPGESPLSALKPALKQVKKWSKEHTNTKLLLVVDQCEELITLTPDDRKKKEFLALLALALKTYRDRLHILLTLRSDFEPQLRDSALEPFWQKARFIVPAMTREELREIIEAPFALQVMHFEPHSLVDQLIDEVAQMPGALPLLSFTLSQLYLKVALRFVEAQKVGEIVERAITQADYEELGGVTRSLTQRADSEYKKLVKQDPAYQQTIPKVMLRMVAIGDELARRRVPRSELEYPQPENERVKNVVKKFLRARLLVSGTDSSDRPYVEPAHDVLVRGWARLVKWKKQQQEHLPLQRRLTPAAVEWNQKQKALFLWNANPSLDLLEEVLHSENNWLNKVETEFVQRSIQRKKFNIRGRWSGAFVVMGVLSIITVLALIGQRNSLIRQAIASQQSARVNLGSNQSLDGMLNSLQAGHSLQHPLVQNPLLQLFSPTDLLQEEIQGTLQWAIYQVKESNRTIGHNGLVRSIVSPNNQFIASAGGDGIINLWNLQGKRLASWQGDKKRVWNVAFSPDNQLLASAGEDGIARLWDLQGKQLAQFEGHTSQVRNLSFSSDGKKLASVGGRDGTIRLWDLQGKLLASWQADRMMFAKTVDFHPHNQLIVTAGKEGNIKIWNLESKLLQTLDFHAWGAYFSPNGKYLVAAGDDGTIALWNSQSEYEYQLVRTWQADDRRLWNVAFSPDSQQIASAGEDGNVRIWNLEGQQLAQFEGHTGPVRSVSFTRDRKHLVSSGDDRTTRLWELSTEQLTEFPIHHSSIKNVS
nr:caspase family protein [Prochloraceae cyanobacterium]